MRKYHRETLDSEYRSRHSGFGKDGRERSPIDRGHVRGHHDPYGKGGSLGYDPEYPASQVEPPNRGYYSSVTSSKWVNPNHPPTPGGVNAAPGVSERVPTLVQGTGLTTPQTHPQQPPQAEVLEVQIVEAPQPPQLEPEYPEVQIIGPQQPPKIKSEPPEVQIVETPQTPQLDNEAVPASVSERCPVCHLQPRT